MAKLIAITGGSGAGKTTIARALAQRLGDRAVLIAEDDYYRSANTIPNFNPDTFNFDEPSAKDEKLLLENLIKAKNGEAFDKPLYDLVTHLRRPETEHVAPHDVVIIEGIHLLAFPALRPLYDLSVYVEADEALRLGRRMIRDTETRGRSARSVLQQFFTNVRPMHELHVAPQRALADLVLTRPPGAGPAEAAANAALIAARLDQV